MQLRLVFLGSQGRWWVLGEPEFSVEWKALATPTHMPAVHFTAATGTATTCNTLWPCPGSGV